MSRNAWIYIWGVFLLAVAFAGLGLVTSMVPGEAWLPFACLTLLAILSQSFRVEVPGRQNYYPHTAFFFAGVLLLPPSLFALLVVIPHVVEWGKERFLKGPHLRSWYIQPFNIAAHIIAGSVAYWLFHAFGQPISSYAPLSVVVSVVAASVYVALNHLLVGAALMLARGVTWQGSGVFGLDSLLPDFIMSCLGYIVAVLLQLSPWMALPALSPLALVHRVFIMLRLKQDKLTDEKTGLWNSNHFTSVLNAEVERARRFNRYLSVVVADLDLPKEITSQYGRLALHTVLAGVGRVVRQSIRQYDVAARAHGETFMLLLPETNPFESLVVAERLRTAIENAGFQVETSPEPITATISIGISCFPGDAVEPAELLQAAEEAARYSRTKGINRIVCYADMPPAPATVDRETGPLKLRGEVFAATERRVGFVAPSMRNPQSR